jgi:copper chaperone NosL
MTRRSVLLGALLVPMALGACGKADRAEDAVWGKQPCAHCKMVLSEPRHAAQALDSDGDRLFFDDLGCLLEHERNRGAELPRAWVKNEQGAWMDARRARYATGARTPMNYGYTSSEAGPLSLRDVKRQITERTGARR